MPNLETFYTYGEVSDDYGRQWLVGGGMNLLPSEVDMSLNGGASIGMPISTTKISSIQRAECSNYSGDNLADMFVRLGLDRTRAQEEQDNVLQSFSNSSYRSRRNMGRSGILGDWGSMSYVVETNGNERKPNLTELMREAGMDTVLAESFCAILQNKGNTSDIIGTSSNRDFRRFLPSSHRLLSGHVTVSQNTYPNLWKLIKGNSGNKNPLYLEAHELRERFSPFFDDYYVFATANPGRINLGVDNLLDPTINFASTGMTNYSRNTLIQSALFDHRNVIGPFYAPEFAMVSAMFNPFSPTSGRSAEEYVNREPAYLTFGFARFQPDDESVPMLLREGGNRISFNTRIDKNYVKACFAPANESLKFEHVVQNANNPTILLKKFEGKGYVCQCINDKLLPFTVLFLKKNGNFTFDLTS